MTKVTLNNVGSLIEATTAKNTINSNSDTIEAAFDNTLSRDGTGPNKMEHSLDMDSNRILNLPQAVSAGEPINYQTFNAAVLSNGGVPLSGTTNQILKKNSNLDYDDVWDDVSNSLVAGTNIAITGTSPATISTIPNLIRGVRAYGASGSAKSTTGTISAGSSSLVLTSAIDFINGQGILILGAGALPTVVAPTGVVVAPVNATGSTTYSYKLISRDNSGGLSAATSAVTITNGHAALGTYQVGTLGVTLNQITWTAGTGSPQSTGVYRSKNGGAYEFIGCFKGTGINDTGLPAVSLLGFPTLPPSTPSPKWLATTITAGGGTTTLTLANVAGSDAILTSVRHDDTAAILVAAAATTALEFPAGTYNVRGLQFPSSVRSIIGDGPGNSSIVSYAETSDTYLAGVSLISAGGSLYVSDIRIVAGLPMAFGGFSHGGSVNSVIEGSEFAGVNGLYTVSSTDISIQNNIVSGWWNVAIFSDTNIRAKISGNIVKPISGQVGALPISGAAPGSGYVWASAIVSIFGSSSHIYDNTIVPQGGVFGIVAAGEGNSVENNLIVSSGREALSIAGNNFKIHDNYCYWAAAGNGNLSSSDYGVSIVDNGVDSITNGTVSGNTFINSAIPSIAVIGSGVGGVTFTNVSVTDNHLFGSNQMSSSYSTGLCSIMLSGSNLSNVTVANNVNHSVTANMTYNVCEQDAGTGVPNNNTVSIPLGESGSLGYVNLLGAGSKYYLKPAASGTILTTASTVPLTVGSSTISSGTDKGLLYDNAGVLGNLATLASGVLVTSAGSVPSISTTLPNIAHGTPTSITLTNGTGLPIGTGLSGAGTGVLTALGINIGSAGATVVFNGAGGTPSSLTLTNAAGLPTTGLTGTLQAAQEPAHTGDVTNSAGSLALTLATAQPAVHTWALAQTFTVAPVFTDQSGSRTALGLGTAATQNTGTSGANLPFLNGINTWASAQTFSAAMTYGGVTLSNSVTGTGSMVLSTSPTLVTPALGTPASGVATNLTGTASGLTAGTVTTNANLTGPITSIGNATSIASQTGTGTKFVVDASPTLTGTPLTTTAAVDTNTTQIASTAFVIAQAASATPLIDGTATVGTSTRFARGDHIHPTDTTRAATVSPTFTGTPLTTTAAVDTNTTQIASTAFVIAQAASATPLIDGTATVGTSTRFARGDHIHPTDTTRAALASPTFTGTVTIPTLTATGVTSYSTSPTASGILNLSGGDASATFTTASMSLGYSSGNTYRHWLHTRHDVTAANNAIDFYTNDGSSSGAGVFPTNGVLGLTVINGNVTTPGTLTALSLKTTTAPTAVSGAGPFLVGSGSTLNSRMKVNLNGTDYWIPCSTTAF